MERSVAIADILSASKKESGAVSETDTKKKLQLSAKLKDDI